MLVQTPRTDELRALGSGEELAKQSLLWLLLMGFVAGLLAVCMPCIWPIIPMTVSFFLKRSKDNTKKGIRDAFTYGLSIIVIYLGLGLLVTALFGSDTLNAMSTNAVFNVFSTCSSSCCSWCSPSVSSAGLRSDCQTVGPTR